MAKKKQNFAPDAKDDTTEAALCPALEGEQGVSSIATGSDLREDAIRSAAYALDETRNGMGGSAEDDWLQAEARIAQIGSSGV